MMQLHPGLSSVSGLNNVVGGKNEAERYKRQHSQCYVTVEDIILDFWDWVFFVIEVGGV